MIFYLPVVNDLESGEVRFLGDKSKRKIHMYNDADAAASCAQNNAKFWGTKTKIFHVVKVDLDPENLVIVSTHTPKGEVK